MRKMAELQLTVVTDPRSRTAIIRQIAQWEENLEKLFIEQYRFRCYSASLQGTELPNPKVGQRSKGVIAACKQIFGVETNERIGLGQKSLVARVSSIIIAIDLEKSWQRLKILDLTLTVI